jgi:triosephosphate isomerase (TIM)
MQKPSSGASARFVVGNWKCRKSLTASHEWLAEFSAGYEPVDGVEVVVAAPMILLAPLAARLQQIGMRHFWLAAQDVSPYPSGNYTGATSAAMLKEVCSHVIVGHPERRRYFHETALDAVNKVSEAADADLAPIIYVDENNAMSQLTALADIDCDRLIIAFNAADELNYQKPPSVEKLSRIASYIAQVYPARPLLYGGRIGRRTHEDFLSVPEISGFVVGDDSLQPRAFLSIVKAVQDAA